MPFSLDRITKMGRGLWMAAMVPLLPASVHAAADQPESLQLTEFYRRGEVLFRCDFAAGIAPFSNPVPAQARHVPDMGCEAPGCLRVDAAEVQFRAPAFPVAAKDYLAVRIRAKTDAVVGGVHVELFWQDRAGAEIGSVVGGTPSGFVEYLVQPLAGTHDWSLLLGCGIAPRDAVSATLAVVCKTSAGTAWFDDAAVVRLPPDAWQGELDRHPARTDPGSLSAADYVRIRKGHLWHDGQRLRIWSAQGNLVAKTHADIDFGIQRFAESGFNGYRTLWWDEIEDSYEPGDLSEWDRRDYLLAALGRKGLWVWNDALNGCPLGPEMVGIIDDPATAAAWQEAMRQWVGQAGGHLIIRSAYASVWDPRMKAIYHAYIRRVLNHVNRHNGLRYSQDPVFYAWELTNEEWWVQRLLWGVHLTLPSFFQESLYARWNLWLRQRYGDGAALQAAWKGLLPGEILEAGTVMLLPLEGETDTVGMAKVLGLNVTVTETRYKPTDFQPQRGADVLHFLTDLLLEAKREASAVFRTCGPRGRGASVVPLVYDTIYSGRVGSIYPQSYSDVVTAGFYVDMSTHDPRQPTFPFASGLREPPVFNGWLDTRRVAGKPTFVYENMIFAPQKYRAEHFYRMLAAAAIQDMDVVDFHYYGHPPALPYVNNPFTYTPLQYMYGASETYGLNMNRDQVLMGACGLAGEIFKRGYLAAAPHPVTVTVGRKTLWNLRDPNYSKYFEAARHTVYHKGFQWAFAPETEEDAIDGHLVTQAEALETPVVEPTRDIAYRWRDGILTIDEPHAKCLVGFAPAEYGFRNGVTFRGIRVETPADMPYAIPGECYVAIGMVALDGRPLARSGQILVSAINTSFNKGFTIDLEKMTKDTDYAHGLGRSITSHGGLPVLEGRVSLTLEAPWLAGRRYRMIDYNRQVLAAGVVTGRSLFLPADCPFHTIGITRE
jgi:hypothetical protein